VSQVASSTQAAANMEGKEARFGAVQSAIYNAAATGTSTGSVDGATDSYTPLGGMVPMVLIQLGEITPGGTGSGLYGMVAFAIVAVFLAGLMVGRTPEYLGKKIEGRDIKYAALAILILPLSILGFAALAVLTTAGQAGPLNPRPPWFQRDPLRLQLDDGEQRQRLRRLSANTLFYDTTLSAAMWLGRIIFVIRCWLWPVRWPGRRSCPPGRAPSPPTPRCSPRC